MQALSWYWRRLRAMSAPEIAWRVRNSVRDRVDRRFWRLRERQTTGSCAGVDIRQLGRRLCDVLPAHLSNRQLNSGTKHITDGVAPSVRSVILQRAEAALRHRFSFFDLHHVDFGERIDWNRDMAAGVQAPLMFAANIDYRDFRRTGDCKLVWEPSRHQHLVALAQAYHLTGDRRFADEIFAQLAHWMDACPFGYGMNWRSPLELAIRLIHWVYALGMTRDTGWADGDFGRRIGESAYQHLWEIDRKYSRYSSANNHLIGEAAGVWIGASAFGGLRGAARMRARARDLIIAQMKDQQHEDGGNREQAFGYHLFVLEFFLLCGLTARRLGEDFPNDYWDGLERMYEFATAILRGGDAPMYGDADDGYVLGLSDYGGTMSGLMSVGAALFDRADWTPINEDRFDRTYWLLGDEASRKVRAWRAAGVAREPRSRAFSRTGIYLIEGRLRPDGRDLSLWMDVGDLGMGALAAHGHADALSLVLRVGGRTILCDPGTFDYFTYPEWRAYFRGTRAHNTIMIDELDQSEPSGPFMWNARARARCLRWEPGSDGGVIEAEQDGYSRLADPVIHRRRVAVRLSSRQVFVTDMVIGLSHHNVHQHWHLGPSCSATPTGDNELLVHGGEVQVLVRVDSALKMSLHRGRTDSPLGWFSPGYHQREPMVTLQCAGKSSGESTYTTVLTILE